MKVELHGAGSRNKGALLMILATIQAFRDFGIKADFAVDPMESLDFDNRASLCVKGVYSLEPICPKGFFQSLLRRLTLMTDRFVRPGQQDRYCMFSRSECDVLIDISGYRYGEYWDKSLAKRFSDLVDFYRSRGRPVILLPQMFGPFETQKYKEIFERVANNVSLIFARDEVSFREIAGNFSVEDKLQLAPDITISLETNPDKTASRKVYIVPNYRLHEKAGIGGQNYENFLEAAYQKVGKAGLVPVFLIHETQGKDRRVAEKVLRNMGVPITESAIEQEDDPLKLKARLAASHFVIASRFHACVSSLSSGVPVLIHGWTYKYRALASDFGVPELMISEADAAAEVGRKIEQLLADRGQLIEIILDQRIKLLRRTTQMWEEVFAKLNESK